jgi:hypothetical protein
MSVVSFYCQDIFRCTIPGGLEPAEVALGLTNRDFDSNGDEGNAQPDLALTLFFNR